MADDLIERLASTEGHTPGPWRVGTEDLRGGRFHVVYRPGGDDVDTIDIHEDDNGERDAALIALAPELKAEVLRLRAQIAEMREALEPFARAADMADDGLEDRFGLWGNLRFGGLRRARATLAPSSDSSTKATLANLNARGIVPTMTSDELRTLMRGEDSSTEPCAHTSYEVSGLGATCHHCGAVARHGARGALMWPARSESDHG